jgi:LacI family transcriptional regulator
VSRIPKVILLIESSRASGRALLHGVADYSRHQGPWSFYWEPDGLEKVRPMLKAGDADGILFRDTSATKEILEYGLPAVAIGHSQTEMAGHVNVVTDSPGIGRLGAKHLLDRGYRHFAYCGFQKTANENAPWSEMRGQFFDERIMAAGFPRPARYDLSPTPQDIRRQRRSLARWLNSIRKPVGLMACNDECGRIIMETCTIAGLAVPDQVGVIGADNDEVVCGLTDPPMSSTAINFERAGYDAAHALARLMQGSKAVPSRIIATASHIAARRSTDFVSAEDPRMSAALRLIRDQARNNLSVTQVALAAGISRGTLEKKFRHLLRRSVLEEIARVRAEQISRLLQETTLPMAEIAEAFGFSDPDAFLKSLQSTKHAMFDLPTEAASARLRNGLAHKDGEMFLKNLPPWQAGVSI